MDYYIDNMGSTLLRWKPRVFLLFRFLKDLSGELRKVHGRNASARLWHVERLVGRDIEYVRDQEYIDCIKMVLEHWYPQLIEEQRYIRYVYDALDLGSYSIEDEFSFVELAGDEQDAKTTA